jgi:hypothetical protein
VVALSVASPEGARLRSRHTVRDVGEVFESLDSDAGESAQAPPQTPVGTARLSKFDREERSDITAGYPLTTRWLAAVLVLY